MSPQPAAPARPAAPAAPETPAQRQIARAKQLERERAGLAERIGKNREYLRLMDANDELSADEAKWLAAFYPEKEKGERRSQEEIEATRKVKAEARESGNGASAS